MRSPLLAAALLLVLPARSALADDAPCSTAAPAVVGCAAPKAVPPPPAPMSVAPVAPPEPRVPPAFYGRFLSYDEETRGVVMGKAHQPLSREELYGVLERADLLERSRAMARRRLIFAISGGAVLVAGVTAAVVARVTMPNLNSAYCTSTFVIYNEICVPDAKRGEAIFATGLIAGISVGGLLGALAMGSNPEVLSRDETQVLLAQHNTTLLQKLRAGARLTPQASSQGGGLTASFTF